MSIEIIETRRRRMATMPNVNRLGKCDVCKSTQAIYTCPRCETVTCSLACVKKHKSQLDCDGVRVKTKYVPVNKMDGNTLLSDYRLLEDIARRIEFAEETRTDLEATQTTATDFNGGAYHPQKRRRKEVADTRTKESNEKIGTVEEDKPKVDMDIIEETDRDHQQGRKHNHKSRRARLRNKLKKLKKTSEVNSKDMMENSAMPTKSEILLARANRIKNKVLNNRNGGVSLLAKEKSENVNDEDDGESEVTISESENLVLECQHQTNKTEVPEEQPNQSEVPKETSEINESIGENIDDQATVADPLKASLDFNLEKSMDTCPESEKFQQKTKIRKKQLLQRMRVGGLGKEAALETVKKVALKRSIAFKTLPHKFRKHYENTTYFLPNENCIYWRIQVSFLNADLFTLSLNQCSERMVLADVIKGCLKRSRAFSRKNKTKDPLEVYRKIGMANIVVLMAADKIPNCQRRFYELDNTKSLEVNFAGKCIVEYPQFCVVLRDCYVAPPVKDDVVYKFFDEQDLDKEEPQEGVVEVKKVKKRKMEKSKSKPKKQNDDDHDRESGELTDSSEDNIHSSSSDSEEELFKETEFRSIYADLLKTI